MRKIRLPKWVGLTASGAAVLALVVWLVVYFFPLQLAELSNRYEFWQEGVKEIHSAGLHGYEQDRCQHALHQSKDCECVVMIHGLADNAMTWKKILLWPENGWLEPVKLFAFDLPGTGGSPAPEQPQEAYRVRNQAHALEQALAPLCPKWMVVGNSLGGWVAAWLALDWPEGVSKLILVDSGGLKGATGQDELQGFLHPTVETLKDFQRRAYYQGRPLPENVWRAAARRMEQSNARQVLEAQQPEDYLDGRITALRRPTLLVWGKEDGITPVSEGLQFKALIPGSIWDEIPQCGHLPQKECPLELIKAIAKMVRFGAV